MKRETWMRRKVGRWEGQEEGGRGKRRKNKGGGEKDSSF